MRALGKYVAAALVAGVLGVGAMPAATMAGEIGPKVPIDKSKGSCVLPGKEMRRVHMDILKHRRDLTMYQGIRGGKQALEACLTCHMVKDEKTGKPVTVASPKHFCRVCHDFAAVQPDCWTCHKSVPEAAVREAMIGPDGKMKASMMAQLRAFVQREHGGRK